jgi:hypothetical protein
LSQCHARIRCGLTSREGNKIKNDHVRVSVCGINVNKIMKIAREILFEACMGEAKQFMDVLPGQKSEQYFRCHQQVSGHAWDTEHYLGSTSPEEESESDRLLTS